ncbi:MarR family transcriptional regulator [Photobacterium aquimaris]|uniref:MarR family transcriptional regulator n=1 Tax=Photobacterium aquimaris TaxID=512643 RepID=A0A2T3ILH9_9GAMM|nr:MULTISPECIES: MarR family transcriptional regulator [Photobacterium]OBU12877.1 MarR family transcriptional regulator [Photobacterium aquimaris]OBU22452.1 MarR family transcriptional regulator [Photobacterium aquimaris]PSU29201.1 MarR family transcriptional regulator [Photobacterium aquimaris]PSW00737.1 MarR family transcriptional regulator [Photobacterium aquimaris]
MVNNTPLDNLFQLVHALKRQLHQQIEQLNLDITPMHVRVIKIINNITPCTAIDIATVLDRDKAQITRLLSTLIDKGFISKAPNPVDKRSSYLCVTDSGMAVIKKLADIDLLLEEKITHNVSTEEIALFQQLAKRMTHNLREQ